ncbi:MAG: oligosaccharide flippase family protein [Candidatus Erginobacter occultus]|nr:oligosaccharide flippase family protein [Candidatus Erginobacter occultus]
MKAKIKQSVKWLLIGRQAQFALALLFQLLIMRILSPEVFGVYALAEAALGFLAMFVSFDFADCVIQFQKVKDIEKNVLGITVLQAGAYAALTFPGVIVVNRIYGGEIARIYLLMIAAHLLSFFSLVFQLMLERELDFKKTEIVHLVARLASIGTILGLGLAGGGVYSLVAGLYVRIILEAALFFRCCRWSYGIGFDRVVFRTVVIYGSKRFLARACATLMKSLDKLILGLMVPVAFVGAYERGLVIVSSATGLVGKIDNRFAFSLINRIKDDTRRLASLINKGIFINLVLAAGFALFTLFYLPDLLILLLGEQWELTARLVPYLSLFLVGKVPAGFIWQVFYADRDPLQIVRGRLIEIALFILLSAGVHYLVTSGEYSTSVRFQALNLGFSSLMGIGYLTAILLRVKQLRPASLARPLLAAVLASLAGWILGSVVGLPSLINFILAGLIYCWLLWIFSRDDLLWFKRYWQSGSNELDAESRPSLPAV